MVLVEDERQQRFVRRFLLAAKYKAHEMAFEPVPRGSGSGEQWVRERYASVVRGFRSRSPRAQTALVIAIDADAGSVEDRSRQLADGLRESALAAREPAERIVHLVPKRNIETWILCLNGAVIDEVTDYHGRKVDDQIKVAAQTLFDWSRPQGTVPAHCIPSLLAAITEVQRLD